MERWATISECGTYRYALGRMWRSSRPRCVFIMLNPSTADAQVDDPTIRRCIGFAERWGMGSLTVINLFALRTPYPANLALHVAPIGPENDECIRQHCQEFRKGNTVVAAWGADRIARARAARVRELSTVPLMCLGKTKSGAPRHPLFVRADKELEEL